MSDTVAVIVQARFNSTRLPGKVMADLGGRPLLAFLLERLKRSKLTNKIIIATTQRVEDDCISALAGNLGVPVVRGSENDVLSRYVLALQLTDAKTLVRITGDCPLVDPDLLDQTIISFFDSGVDYLSNFTPPTYPDGLDIEVFTRESLLLADSGCTDAFSREHVTPWIRENKQFSTSVQSHSSDLSSIRLTVDEPEDLIVIRSVVDHFKTSSQFSWTQVIDLYKKQPNLFSPNSKFLRNEGATMSSGQKLWRRAKKIIPGGNMLLSKRSEMHLPDHWPSYFSQCKGCKVWDLDGKEFIDMSIMGIGTNLLGYSHPAVDEAVSRVISTGNMCTLNCPEEVHLAEKLVELHPWSDMVRFARSGGEANAIAIRIARASTGKDKIAICGYHGWHDWYLATNLTNTSGLEEHLLPGLQATGVPSALAGTTIPFSFNRFDQLQTIISANPDLAAVKMEVQRSSPPDPGFLQKVRKLCTEKGIVLIFDECTSGFREVFGGLHLKYEVYPDIAMFGKALGNGYAITSILGTEAVMQAAQNTFISSTFWTERIGPAAALKTLEIMETEKSWEIVTQIGTYVRSQWQVLSDSFQIPIVHSGLPALAGYSFQSMHSQQYKTLITQEMLKRGFLASTCLYASTAHSKSVISAYFNELHDIFSLIKDCETGIKSIDELLDGPVAHTGFARLN